MKLDTFTQAYVEASLWSSTDDDNEPLDGLYDADCIALEALQTMIAECQDFQTANAEDIATDLARAGHDFWLTRNHHGAGFWDGDWAPAVGQRLTQNAHAYGECNLYVGDDGLLYVM